MFSHREPPIVISVGGSLIVPDAIDTDFLRKLNDFIRSHVKKGRRFLLVAGGGRAARLYRDAGRSVIGNLTDEDLDWLGIHATRLNAHLLRTIFQDIAHHRIIDNYGRKVHGLREPITIGSGWKPGWSTDYCAAMMAKHYGAKVIINLSNVDWVYDKDPRKFPDAKKIEKITWEEMEDLVGTKWKPGMNTPFDPVAAQLAKKHGYTVVVTNGHDFDNLEKIIEGEHFKGTVITPFKIDAGFYDREYYTGKKGEYRLGYAESFFGRIFHGLVAYYRALTIKLWLNPKNCLDVGCGTGRLIKSLRFFGIDAHGVEISKDAIKLADPNVKKFIKEGDILDIPFGSNEFDLVLTYDVLEHIERSKIHQAVGEMVRVARKAVLNKIYTTENRWIEICHAEDFSHVSVLPRRYWKKLFSSLENVETVSGGIFRLPSFFESVFLFRKK